MDRQKKTTNLVKISKNDSKNNKKVKIIVLFAIILIFSSLCLLFNVLNPLIVTWLEKDFSIVSARGNLIVHFVDVGQGDAIAINLPDGKVCVIDAGPVNSTAKLMTCLTEKVMNSKRNKTIDYLILTHADSDHIGGAEKLVKTFDFGTIYMPMLDGETETFKKVQGLVDKENCSIEKFNKEIEIQDNFTLKLFPPLAYTDMNNTCPLIKLEFYGKTFLFTGDIEAKAEKQYVALYGDELDIDVLKVGHHGSKYSSCEEFLACTTPKYAIISSGNRYGHPNEETIERLSNVNANIVRTDASGNIMFAVGKNYDLSLLTGQYVVSGFIFDYRIIVLIIDVVLIGNIVIILIKKNKKQKN